MTTPDDGMAVCTMGRGEGSHDWFFTWEEQTTNQRVERRNVVRVDGSVERMK